MRTIAILMLLAVAGCTTAPPSQKTIDDNAYCTRLYGAIHDEKQSCLYERSIGNNDPRDPFPRSRNPA